MAILTGISSFIFSMLIAVLVVYITFRFFTRLTRGDGLAALKNGNTAIAIAITGQLVAFGILMARCLYPVSAVLQDLFLQGQVTVITVLRTFGIIAGYAAIAYILSVFTVAVSSWLFQKLTVSIDEKSALQANNIAVAVMLAGIVITVAIMVQSGLADALNVLIPQAGSGDVRLR